MITKVKKTIAAYNMLDRNKVIVALSGGADSMCLLDVLIKLKDELDIQVSAVHINHQIRGEEAYRDENFVRAYCKENNIPLQVFQIDVPEIAVKNRISLELAGRNERYRIFSEISQDAKVATAHNLNDSEETFLFNLARGTGLSGLCGISHVRDNYIRPLIVCTKEEIIQYCKENSVPFIVDSTNSDNDYSRNYIRNEIIPKLIELNQAFHSNFARSIAILKDDNDCLNDIVGNLVEHSCIENSFSISDILNEHNAIRCRFIQKIIENLSDGDYESKHIDYINDNLGKDFAVTLPGGDIIKSDGKFIYKQVIQDKIFLSPTIVNNSGKYFFGNYVIEINYSENKEISDLSFSLDKDLINGDLIIDTRKAGDEINIAGRQTTRKLKKLYTDAKIPAQINNTMPILRDKEGIVLAYPFGPDERVKITDKTKNILSIDITEVL
jgi:tRNA(Ile)-lysidine synthase